MDILRNYTIKGPIVFGLGVNKIIDDFLKRLDEEEAFIKDLIEPSINQKQ